MSRPAPTDGGQLDPIAQRKALIAAKMAEERQLRRQMVAQGRIDEFRLQDLSIQSTASPAFAQKEDMPMISQTTP